ncbi:hypothetical protein E1264_15400 [Actinomadura sp. KC216]|uniref:hypothetical protein n=1 Tax=Actinomadura sp. KC216 TaxID=2530370 RepID=UPI00104E37F8|nr:hypothetical protein [Actinomadura sp. KC216]TDB87174.1 hypothetical protein E1264_15400 [Actinomadura sp. KC216]
MKNTLSGARRWALASFTVLATATALVGTATSASATPTDCTTVNGGNFAESRCTGGTGEHRVVMVQRHFNPAVGLIACEGPWVPVGSVSRTLCANQTVISVSVQTR